MQSLLTMSRNILYNTLLPVASNERENIAKKFLKFDLRPKSSGLLPHHSSKIFELLLLFFFWMTYLRLTEVAFFTFYCQGLKYHFKKVLMKISV